MSDVSLTTAKRSTWADYVVRVLVREIQHMKKGDMVDSTEFADLVTQLGSKESVADCIGAEKEEDDDG